MTPPFFTQDKTCPVCNTNFKVTRVRSSAYGVLTRDTDFFVTYNGPDPNVYNIWVCPNCLFSVPLKSFEEEIRPAELQRLQKGLTILKSEEPDFAGERDYQLGLRSYELAIRTAQIRQATAGFQASLFLKAAWMCRHLKNKDGEMAFTERARELYEHSFFNEGFASSKMSEPSMIYLIGELNRRLGKYNEAIQWFARGISNPKTNAEAEIKRLMRDQWQLSRELAKESSQDTGVNTDASQSLESEAPEVTSAATEPASEPETSAPYRRPANRNRSKLFAALYNDQIEWLQGISNKIYSNKGVLLEREAVLRAVIDVVMELNPTTDEVTTEKELVDKLIAQIKTP